MEIDSGLEKIPDYTLSEDQYLLQLGSYNGSSKEIVDRLIKEIKANSMAPYYRHLKETLADFPYDEALYKEMEAVNEKEISGLTQKIKEAEGEDETELDALACNLELAQYYAKIVDRTKAVETYEKALELPQSSGSKIDILLAVVRIEFFFNDYALVGKYLDQVKTHIDKGGDWERRNRYKTYNGIYLMATRKFAEAAKLLIDSLATFTSTELCSYEQVAQYAIVCGVLSLDRVDLKEKIIDLPELLSIYSNAQDLLDPIVSVTNSLYTCQYGCFFQYLLETHDRLLVGNKYLHQHAQYFLRELRCKAYGQLLESYKSLSTKSMAQSFNISEDFLDQDLCRFIPTKKLNCTIDKVNGIIETNRPDNKNNQYHLLIKQGDQLLTKLQKYGAAVKLSGAEKVA